MSRKKTIEHTIDPRKQITPDLKGVRHGIENANHKTFLQTNDKVKPEPIFARAPLPKNNAQPTKHADLTKQTVKRTNAQDALEEARHVELTAKKLSEGMTVNLFKMIIIYKHIGT